MDKQLAAIDPSLKGVLTAGGEEDSGGDLKVHDDPLSRAVFKKATGAAGGGRDSMGPGPSISNTYNNQSITVTVNQDIDASSSSSTESNIRESAHQAGERAGKIVLTNALAVLGLRNGGGVIR